MFITKIIRSLMVLAAVLVCTSQSYASNESDTNMALENLSDVRPINNDNAKLTVVEQQVPQAQKLNCCLELICTFTEALEWKNPNFARNCALFIGGSFVTATVLSSAAGADSGVSPFWGEAFNAIVSWLGG